MSDKVYIWRSRTPAKVWEYLLAKIGLLDENRQAIAIMEKSPILVELQRFQDGKPNEIDAVNPEHYKAVRAALIGIIGTEDPEKLNTMRAGINQADDVTPEQKAETIAAIDALLLTNPNKANLN